MHHQETCRAAQQSLRVKIQFAWIDTRQNNSRTETKRRDKQQRVEDSGPQLVNCKNILKRGDQSVHTM